MEVSNPFSDCGQSIPAVTSLATALRVGEEVFREALQKAPALPKLADVGRAPATLAEAVLARDAKEEERRRREAVRKDVKMKGKQVTPLPAVVEQAAPAPTPGLHIGSVNEASAFWMFVEDYFRDVTQEDIISLMPVALNPEDDDCLTVPFLGRDPRGVDRPATAKGKQVPVREEENAVERRGRGRGAGKLELRFSEGPTMASGSGPSFFPQSPFPHHQDALVQGWRPDGRPAATMLDACTDDEARSFCQLADNLGFLEDLNAPDVTADCQLGAATFASMDRAQLDRVLMKLAQLGDPGTPETAASGPFPPSGDAPCHGQQPVPAADGGGVATKPAATVGTAAEDEDTQSSNRGTGLGQELLPRTAGGDYMHPYLRRILERPCTAYVLNPCGGTGSLVEMAQDDDEGLAGAASGMAATGSRGMRSSQTIGAGANNMRTPAPGRGGYRSGHNSTAHEAVMSPHGQLGGEIGLSSLHTGPSTANLQDMLLDISQSQTLQPLQHGQPNSQDDVTGGLGAGPHSACTPTLGGPGFISGAGNSGGGRGGRARNSVNYSALAGKKDKDREREMREREREERERAKTVVPRVKRRPGPRGGASWSAGGGSAAAALAGLQKPLTNNPLALLNKVPLLFKDEPGSNATTAAVHSMVAEGGPEGTLEQQWTQLDAAADVMAMAPDDEVLAELVALQSELVQQVAINRSRVAVLMEAVLADLPNQRAVNQQHAEMEDHIRTYLQRKAEVKRNLKREKREMEKRQALAALNEPASPRAVTGRPKKFASVPLTGYEGVGNMVTESVEPEETWRGSTPGASGGEGPPVEAMVVEDVELLDPLAHRTHDEEALCAICGDGLSVDPNMIVFCERCDIAVHQHCYGVRSIPAEEWLCWPCRLYEESQHAAGVPQSEIRPKRWEMEARGISHSELPGGSLTVSCCLCPVRQGAFKRTVETKAWCHVVCALWHEGPTVMHADAPDVIDSLALIKPERWRSPCTICGKIGGAVAKCNFGHCQCYFHPLCARRSGNYLVARLQPGSKQLRYRIYCHNHSESQRNKDIATGAAARPQDVYAAAATTTATTPITTTSAGPGRPSKRSSMGVLAGTSTSLEGVDVGFGSAPATMAPTPALPLGAVDMPASEPDAAALAGSITMPVRKKFGRPPKILKQQQLMLQQMQLYQMQQQQQEQQPLLSPQAGGPLTPAELQAPGQQPLPLPGGMVHHQIVPLPATPGLGTNLLPAQPEDMLPASAPTTGTDSTVAAASAAALVGRPPLPGSRLSLSAMAKRKQAAGAGIGPGAGGHDGAGGPETAAITPVGALAVREPATLTQLAPQLHLIGPPELSTKVKVEAASKRRGPGRASSSTSLQAVPPSAGTAVLPDDDGDDAATEDQFGAAGDVMDCNRAGTGTAAVARATGTAKAMSSKTSGGAGAGKDLVGAEGGAGKRLRPTSSAAGAAAGAGSVAPGVTVSSGPKYQRLKSEPLEEHVGEGDSAVGPSISAAAAAAAAMARTRTAAAAAAAGPSGAVTMERLADLEHQRSMLGRWGPNSVRQELELLRTMADTVRRRERCKRAQYRLLRDAISEQDSQPVEVLSFLESWEWPSGLDVTPFSPEDFAEPPAVTVMDRLLEANQAALAAVAAVTEEGTMETSLAPTSRGVGGGASGSAGAGGSSAAGIMKRQRTDGGAGGLAPGISSGGGDEQHPLAKRVKLRSNIPAEGGMGGDTMKEIMSGRDWRRRVVMGPDGKWVPRPAPGPRNSRARSSGLGTSAPIGDGAVTTGGGGGGGAYSSSKASRDDATTAAQQDVEVDEMFQDAQDAFVEGAVTERDADMEETETGAEAAAPSSRITGHDGDGGGGGAADGMDTDRRSSSGRARESTESVADGFADGGVADSAGEAMGGMTTSGGGGNDEPGAGHTDLDDCQGPLRDGGGGSGAASPLRPGGPDLRPVASPSVTAAEAGGRAVDSHNGSRLSPQQRVQVQRDASGATESDTNGPRATGEEDCTSSDDPPIAALMRAAGQAGGTPPT